MEHSLSATSDRGAGVSPAQNRRRDACATKSHSHLLISVRSSEEAEAALSGGADLIDIKEPRRGSLGKADDAIISAVIELVAGRRPVSAAMGELIDEVFTEKTICPLKYLKWGLAGCGLHPDWWQAELLRRKAIIESDSPGTQVVIVAYADAELAEAPPVKEVVDFACTTDTANVLLIDTFSKQAGVNLLRWLTKNELAKICRQCRAAGTRIALAGSLGEKEIAELLDLQPDWFAVRGAACKEGRESTICQEKVRQLNRLLSLPIS